MQVILEQNMRLEKLFEPFATKKFHIEQARKNKLQLDWEIYPVKPNLLEQVIEVELDVLVPYIDWTPFF
jgi:cobalamin-dependent methionine synthase I